ncbi:diacylglycerol kinase family protein [Bacillus sp. FJAT-29790]|uniref:diacylglycerol kinase family protein n=1 Tax=Bacillus sp. FJAT-29790 TaxID=1895002 RepID=UPI001C21ADAF|nr:diacylglycerol kinase family protein [Bacillus sp. FJAT-29790]MBU8879431.1 diacylglycerol kinase family protein [Bacillus sp. FJAT-29790]
MNSGSGVKKHQLIRSFGFAISGIKSAVLKERNMKIHLLISIAVIGLGIWLSLSTVEWLFVLFAIGGMLSLELLNTAIERAVDLVTAKYHPLAKEAKDIAAGSVLIYALLSVITGLIIFLPKIILHFH